MSLLNVPIPALSTTTGWRDHAARLLDHAEPISRIAPYVALAIIYAWSVA